jgi:hypothetical protein
MWINKNNYIYHNQQRFVNYTRDAVRGIAEQLGPKRATEARALSLSLSLSLS